MPNVVLCETYKIGKSLAIFFKKKRQKILEIKIKRDQAVDPKDAKKYIFKIL